MKMLLEIIAVGGVAIGVGGYLVAKKKNIPFSQGEALVISHMKQEAEKALHDFSVGKEDVLSIYESLKARVASLNSVSAKLPALPVAQPAAVPVVVQPPHVIYAQPTVAVAPEVAVIPPQVPPAV